MIKGSPFTVLRSPKKRAVKQDMEFNFEKLDVYKDAVTFASQVYEMTKLFPDKISAKISALKNSLRT